MIKQLYNNSDTFETFENKYNKLIFEDLIQPQNDLSYGMTELALSYGMTELASKTIINKDDEYYD